MRVSYRTQEHISGRKEKERKAMKLILIKVDLERFLKINKSKEHESFRST